MDVVHTNSSYRRRGHGAIRGCGIALRINIRVLAMTLVALGVLAMLLIWTMTLGDYQIAFPDVVAAVFGHGDDRQLLIVRELRLPRVLSAAEVGAALAVSGAIFQGLIRNPLVSPDMIGIDNGAGLLAVFWIVTGMSAGLLPVAAFGGALIAAALVYGFSWRGGINPNRLILVGIGIGAMLQAGTTFLTVRYPIEQARPAIVWSIGSLYGRDWTDVRVLTIFLAVGLPAALALSWPLRAIQLGDDGARLLGLRLERTRLALLAVGCALAAVAVAVAGPIGFVALMVPHAARAIAGPLSGSVLLLSAVLGACFLLLADAIGEHLLPVSLPAGIVTAGLGAPYFLLLIYRLNARL